VVFRLLPSELLISPLLSRFSPSEPSAETEPTVLEADSEAPYGIEQRLGAIIADASERICGAATSFGSPMTLSRTVDRVEAGVDFEWALPQAVLERLERQHDELHATVLPHDNTAVYVTEEVIDLSLYDDTLVLTGFDADRGTLAAVATTDSPDAVDWALDVVESHRERGQRLG